MGGFSPIALAVAAVAVVIVVIVLARLLGPKDKADWMECPSCQKTLQKGRRFCPFCKEKLTNY
jgi:predicted amidophosphoribosyltransferase